MAETIEVPFITVGNRRALTRLTIANEPAVADFVRRFAHCFECDPYTDMYLFIEEGQERTWPAPTFVK
jgi:hypothetical protein